MSLADNVKQGFNKVAEQFNRLAKVATSGSYNDLTDKPEIPSLSNVMYTDRENVMTGSNMYLVRRDTTDSAIMIRAGTGIGTGAVLSLIGNTINDDQAGEWELASKNGSTNYALRGTPSGGLIFNGEHLVRKINGTTADNAGNVSITIPTQTSQLTNNSGFLTAHQNAENVVATEDYVAYFNQQLAS